MYNNKLYYFIPFFGKQCGLGFSGIRDLYLIKIARIGTRKEGEPDNDPNDLRIVFELQFVKHLYDQYMPHRLKIWETFTDTTLATLSETTCKVDETVFSEGKLELEEGKLTHIDCFAGPGGICTGLHAAGFQTLLAIEYIKSCCETYSANHPDVRVIHSDIRKVTEEQILPYIPDTGVDLVTSGMPCETFSTAGNTSRSFYDDRQFLFREGIRIANEGLIARANGVKELDGMGTTFVLASIDENNELLAANIGDSRLYLINEEGLRQITMDHSLVAEMVRKGEIKKDEARYHPQKNVVLRAISTRDVAIPEFYQLRVKAGDFILLCSDGLSDMLECEDGIVTLDMLDEAEMMKIIGEYEEVSDIAEKMVAIANENGGKDNITLVLIKV